jgi:hypothetical protein
MTELNILVLHSLGNPRNSLGFLKHHVFLLKNYFPQHNYLYHDIALPLPEYVQETLFDAILLDVTFLCRRWAPEEQFASLKDAYQFVRQSDSAKIAFPQDEYDCHELLDEWMRDWCIDIVYSVLSSGWEVLYPTYHKVGRIEIGYTGYVDESLIDFPRKPFNHRTIDIGYRAMKLPPYFGRIGEIKWMIGRDVELKCSNTDIKTDIVMGENGILHGNAWFDFINNCKFTLGTNSGSSLLDPRGDIQRRVRAYLLENPSSSFEEVEKTCFKGLDGHHSFTAISPRVLEAALLDSCQILVKGSYSGIVKPWEHYIPISDDASNFPEVLEAMRDHSLVQKLIRDCRAAILDCEGLRYRNTGRKLLEQIENLGRQKGIKSKSTVVRKVIKRYNRHMSRKYTALWRKQSGQQNLLSYMLSKLYAVSRLVRPSNSLVKSSQ